MVSGSVSKELIILRVGIHARVSTHEQQTLPMQLAALRKYARARKWKVVLEIEDVGSGAKEQKKRENLLQAARRRDPQRSKMEELSALLKSSYWALSAVEHFTDDVVWIHILLSRNSVHCSEK